MRFGIARPARDEEGLRQRQKGVLLYFSYFLSEIYHLAAACRFFKVRAGLFLYLHQWSVGTGEVSQQLASWRHRPPQRPGALKDGAASKELQTGRGSLKAAGVLSEQVEFSLCNSDPPGKGWNLKLDGIQSYKNATQK